VIWFAVLQMLSPLIHAHVEADASVQGHGLHMHVQELVQGDEKIPASKYVTASLHTVGVDKALLKFRIYYRHRYLQCCLCFAY